MALLYSQFGAHPAKASDKRTVDNFRTKCLRELKKIKLAWPELNYTTAKGVLILHPSTPPIPPAPEPLASPNSLSVSGSAENLKNQTVSRGNRKRLF